MKIIQTTDNNADDYDVTDEYKTADDYDVTDEYKTADDYDVTDEYKTADEHDTNRQKVCYSFLKFEHLSQKLK